MASALIRGPRGCLRASTGAPVRVRFSYEPAEKPKSDLYRDLLPLINARKIDLLDDKRLQAQLIGLERRTSRAGKDSIGGLAER